MLQKKIRHLFDNIDHQEIAQRLLWINNSDDLPRAKGVYILAMQLADEVTLNIGKLGTHTLPASTYFYVGSARGAGGLYSRIKRHWRNDKDKAKRWHIDYLREPMQMLGCWVVIDDFHASEQTSNDAKTNADIEECALAEMLVCHPSLSTFAQVGSSDCHCSSHVFYFH